MAARIGNIASDCDDVLQLAAFWSAVLGRPLDQRILRRSQELHRLGLSQRPARTYGHAG